MLRHRCIATKRYYSTSCMRTNKQTSTCGQAALTEMDQLLLPLRRASAVITLARDKVLFDERSYKLAALAVESFERIGKESSDLIDPGAASIVGGTDRSSLARKDVCKEYPFQTISATTQVVISRRVHRYIY